MWLDYWSLQEPWTDWGHNDRNAYYLDGDTTVMGLGYQKLMVNAIHHDYLIVPPNTSTTNYVTGQLKGLLRQDAALRQVYFYNPDSLQEYLLYDFSVGLGVYPATYTNSAYPTTEVTEVDSVLLPDGYHRRLVLNYYGMGGGYHAIIEGVGSTLGLFEPIRNVAGTPWNNHLECHQIANSTIYAWPYLPTNHECTIWLTANDREHNGALSLNPNPATDRCTLTTQIGQATYKLIDLSGRIAAQGACEVGGTTMINTAGIPAGLYTVEVLGSGPMLRAKLVKE